MSAEEVQWLEVFANYNPFFKDLLRYFSKNTFLSEKQYECLEREIERAEDEGNNILDEADLKFLKEQAKENDELQEILENYKEDGFIDKFDFNTFIDIKLELNPDFNKRDTSSGISGNVLQEKNSKKFTPDDYQLKTKEKIATHKIKKDINLQNLKEFLNKEYLAKNQYSDYLTYVLKLENNKWWIGKSRVIFSKMEKLKRDKGNKWLTDNPIISIEKLLFGRNTALLTLEYMKKYGWENVRGSSYYDNQVEMYIPIKILNYVSEQKKLKPSVNDSVEKFDKMEDNNSRDLEESTYVLKLENNKWYIGRTFDLDSDLKMHQMGKKTSWTKLYEVKSVEEKDLYESIRDVTIRYMNKYGWWNVRGPKFRKEGEKWPPDEIKDQFEFSENKTRENPIVYILRLEHDKWFIGKTYNIEKSMKFHKLGSPPWLDIHKLIEVEKILEDGSVVEITLDYMRKYGWENVRGAHWKSWDLKRPPRVLREK